MGLWSPRSDGKGHKVTVTRQSFPASLYYYCVPSKETAAFLMACAVNESQFTFLSSPAASVFSGTPYAAQGLFRVCVLS